MTYLQLINKVLVGLREDTVLGIAEASSRLIGQLVNEAKEEIEDMGPWFALRSTVTTTTSANVETADITASTNERAYILHGPEGNALAWITTSGEETPLALITQEQMNDAYNADATQDTGKPLFFSYSMSNTGMTLRFYPLPDATYTVKLRCVVPQAELSATTDVLTIAAAPVWKLALAKAMDERGSEFSGGAQTNWAKAEKAIRDYILRDFGTEPWTFRAE